VVHGKLDISARVLIFEVYNERSLPGLIRVHFSAAEWSLTSGENVSECRVFEVNPAVSKIEVIPVSNCKSAAGFRRKA
jgi:hypothetical protein